MARGQIEALSACKHCALLLFAPGEPVPDIIPFRSVQVPGRVGKYRFVPMESALMALRASEAQKKSIRVAAGLEGVSMQAWIDRAVREKLAIESRNSPALARAMREVTRTTTPTKD